MVLVSWIRARATKVNISGGVVRIFQDDDTIIFGVEDVAAVIRAISTAHEVEINDE